MELVHQWNTAAKTKVPYEFGGGYKGTDYYGISTTTFRNFSLRIELMAKHNKIEMLPEELIIIVAEKKPICNK